MYYCDGQTVRSGVIREAHVEPSYNEATVSVFYHGFENVTFGLLSSQNDLVVISVKTINGTAYCLFTRPASVNRTISNNVKKNFDLNAEKYYLLAASGLMAGDSIIPVLILGYLLTCRGILSHLWRFLLGSTSPITVTIAVSHLPPILSAKQRL